MESMPQSINKHLFCLLNFSVVFRDLSTEENVEQNDKSILRLLKIAEWKFAMCQDIEQNCHSQYVKYAERPVEKLLRAFSADSFESRPKAWIKLKGH